MLFRSYLWRAQYILLVDLDSLLETLNKTSEKISSRAFDINANITDKLLPAILGLPYAIAEALADVKLTVTGIVAAGGSGTGGGGNSGATVVDAITTATETGVTGGETSAGAPITGAPMPAGKTLAQSLFDLAAIVAKRPTMKYGGPDWLEQMRSMQEGTLASVLKGFDPNNPMGYAPTAAAYAENTGPAYQSWLSGAIGSTKDVLAKWNTWLAAVAEAQRAVGDAVGRQKTPAIINVFMNGRQVGNALIEDLALQGVTM